MWDSDHRLEYFHTSSTSIKISVLLVERTPLPLRLSLHHLLRVLVLLVLLHQPLVLALQVDVREIMRQQHDQDEHHDRYDYRINACIDAQEQQQIDSHVDEVFEDQIQLLLPLLGTLHEVSEHREDCL